MIMVPNPSTCHVNTLTLWLEQADALAGILFMPSKYNINQHNVTLHARLSSKLIYIMVFIYIIVIMERSTRPRVKIVYGRINSP